MVTPAPPGWRVALAAARHSGTAKPVPARHLFAATSAPCALLPAVRDALVGLGPAAAVEVGGRHAAGALAARRRRRRRRRGTQTRGVVYPAACFVCKVRRAVRGAMAASGQPRSPRPVCRPQGGGGDSRPCPRCRPRTRAAGVLGCGGPLAAGLAHAGAAAGVGRVAEADSQAQTEHRRGEQLSCAAPVQACTPARPLPLNAARLLSYWPLRSLAAQQL